MNKRKRSAKASNAHLFRETWKASKSLADRLGYYIKKVRFSRKHGTIVALSAIPNTKPNETPMSFRPTLNWVKVNDPGIQNSPSVKFNGIPSRAFTTVGDWL